ncbi:NAD(P)H-dependent flavin oxidoreductase [Vibrio furnissii]|uniref:NAD(P)H-dependent flavin oxidoreductase n=1 Tax=Vibrio furnissii TaxID=29494 RepID=UPI0023DB74A9|nr:nitronate monooxygenase [Vibrio furnissii]
MYKGKITELLGSEFPIIQAPMAGVQDSTLAIAVCDAGGLGSLPCGMLSADKIESEIKTMQAATDTAFNLNFFCHAMPPHDAEQQGVWRETLRPYFDELGSAPEHHSGGASRLPFSHDIADAIEPYHPRVISFHFGLPSPELVTRVKSWGCAVLSSATTLQEALWLEAHGADAIIAQGIEAGGHRGMFLTDDVTTQLGTLALVPQIAHNVRIPVIASGGIADGRGIKAALTLGAEAVQLGTAYLLCSEAKTSPLHRQAIATPRAEHTALTNLFSGRPARGIVNRAMRDLGYLSALAPQFPYASAEMSALRALAEPHGRDDFSPLWCGQNTSGCVAISAAELTLLLASESGMCPLQ